MPVEAATTINQLVATNPLHTDGLDEADSHLRLLKATLQTTFPNITGAVTASHTDLNNVTGLISTAGGLLKIPAPSPAVGTTGGQILLNGASGQMDMLLTNAGGALTFFVGNAAGGTSTSWTVLSSLSTAGALSLTGAVGATSVLKGGNELLPIGTILMWSGSIATVPAGWHICDGTNGTPNLTGRFILHADGSAFAPTQTGGAGAVTATTSTIAGHSHGGLTGAAGGATPSGVTDGQGSHAHGGATGATALTIAQMPAHTHQQSATGAFPGFGSVEGSLPNAVGPGSLTPDLNTGSTGNGAGHSHPIAVDGAHQHNLVINALPAHQHTISLDGSHSHTVTVATLPFFYALAYIMKIS